MLLRLLHDYVLQLYWLDCITSLAYIHHRYSCAMLKKPYVSRFTFHSGPADVKFRQVPRSRSSRSGQGFLLVPRDDSTGVQRWCYQRGVGVSVMVTYAFGRRYEIREISYSSFKAHNYWICLNVWIYDHTTKYLLSSKSGWPCFWAMLNGSWL